MKNKIKVTVLLRPGDKAEIKMVKKVCLVLEDNDLSCAAVTNQELWCFDCPKKGGQCE